MNAPASNRRHFLKLSAVTALGGILAPRPLRADDPIGAIYQRLVPAQKGLDAQWAVSLAKRGSKRDAGKFQLLAVPGGLWIRIRWSGRGARLCPEDQSGGFPDAFTAVLGWGSFTQKQSAGRWSAVLALAHG